MFFACLRPSHAFPALFQRPCFPLEVLSFYQARILLLVPHCEKNLNFSLLPWCQIFSPEIEIYLPLRAFPPSPYSPLILLNTEALTDILWQTWRRTWPLVPCCQKYGALLQAPSKAPPHG